MIILEIVENELVYNEKATIELLSRDGVVLDSKDIIDKSNIVTIYTEYGYSYNPIMDVRKEHEYKVIIHNSEKLNLNQLEDLYVLGKFSKSLVTCLVSKENEFKAIEVHKVADIIKRERREDEWLDLVVNS